MIRRKPYTPIFDITPVSSMATGVGAAAYAGACQMCSGASGTFTHSPASTAQKISGLTSTPFSASAMKSNVPVSRYKNRKPSSIATLPSTVNRKKFSAALCRSSPLPKSLIRKKGGTSASSQ